MMVVMPVVIKDVSRHITVRGVIIIVWSVIMIVMIENVSGHPEICRVGNPIDIICGEMAFAAFHYACIAVKVAMRFIHAIGNIRSATIFGRVRCEHNNHHENYYQEKYYESHIHLLVLAIR
jgi:hypothetical protein